MFMKVRRNSGGHEKQIHTKYMKNVSKVFPQQTKLRLFAKNKRNFILKNKKTW